MGAGYVTPLATALKWYPDKHGLVVMGMGAGSIFGGMGGPYLIDKIGPSLNILQRPDLFIFFMITPLFLK